MLPFAFEVNNFFRSVKLLFHRGVSRFLQSRGAFMLPFASGVNRFFRFREISFRLRFREPFSLVAKGEIALNQPHCQATSANIFKTITPNTRKSALGAEFRLLLNHQPGPGAQVFLVHAIPALEIIHTHIIGTGDLPQGVVCLHGVGFATFGGSGFVLLVLALPVPHTAIGPGAHRPPRWQCSRRRLS